MSSVVEPVAGQRFPAAAVAAVERPSQTALQMPQVDSTGLKLQEMNDLESLNPSHPGSSTKILILSNYFCHFSACQSANVHIL